LAVFGQQTKTRSRPPFHVRANELLRGLKNHESFPSCTTMSVAMAAPASLAPPCGHLEEPRLAAQIRWPALAKVILKVAADGPPADQQWTSAYLVAVIASNAARLAGAHRPIGQRSPLQPQASRAESIRGSVHRARFPQVAPHRHGRRRGAEASPTPDRPMADDSAGASGTKGGRLRPVSAEYSRAARFGEGRNHIGLHRRLLHGGRA